MTHPRLHGLPLYRSGTFASRLLGLLVLAIALSACHARFPSEQVPKMKWLIMPFDQPPVMGTTPPLVRGWWLGASTIRENPRAGAALADVLSTKMAPLDYLNLYSRIDLKYYFADKAKLLKDAYPELSEAERETMIRQVPATEYARELGADKVLSGRILRQYMAENRTFHWWWSVLDVDCQITDAATGRIGWEKHYYIRQQFGSQNSVQEKFANQLIADLEETYFRPMIRK